jgi:predicted ATPase/signal transduction histidine kinase
MRLLSDMELLHNGLRTDIYLSDPSGEIILKVLKTDAPLTGYINRLHNELNLCGSKVKGMRTVLGKELVDDKQALQLQYIKGTSWRSELKTGLWDIDTFLKNAIQAAESLDNVHSAGLIHQEISPDHILLNETDSEAVFIGFGGAIRKEAAGQVSEQEIDKFQEQNLPYISPEQTGRTSEYVSVATDLYALGAVFYQMLTGKLPFELEDPLALIHAHIAKTPTAPHELRTEVPAALSILILKLLEKHPEKRYASASDLASDLVVIHEQWKTLIRMQEELLTSPQKGVQAKIPGDLYGRDKEVAELQEIYNNVTKGEVVFTLISGPSGVNKSSLIRSLRSPVKSSSGLFIEGKFDPYQKDTPYLAIQQAFNQLVAHILTCDQKELKYWEKRIAEAMGNVGRVLTEIVPNLNKLIGEQPNVPRLEGTEAQNRFLFACRNFIAAVADKKHPLVLFVDDLQWADVDSVNLLESLEGDSRISHFMIIGAFRKEHLPENDPVRLKLRSWKETSENYIGISVDNLDTSMIQLYIRDTFQANIVQEETFLRKIAQKTKGNPLYLQLLISTLIKKKIITFDPDSKAWFWRPEDIDQLNLPDSTLDMMTARVQYLEVEVQTVLTTAACHGNRFNAEMVEKILGIDAADCKKQLTAAVEEGLIIPDASQGNTSTYQFAHERLRQMSYDLLSDDEKEAKHLSIGKFLFDSTSKENRSPLIFDILLQLNRSHTLITDPEFRLQVAIMNFDAGTKARNSAAFGSAYTYMMSGIAILGPSAWNTTYSLMLVLHSQAHNLAALNGDYVEMDQIAETVKQHAKSLLDLEKITQSQIHALIAQKKLDESIQVGLAYVKELGIKFPANPKKTHVVKGILELKVKMWGKKAEALERLPEMENEEMLSAVRILSETAIAAYFGSPNLLPLILFKTLTICLKYGIAAETAFAYGGYGFILSGAMRDYNTGYEFGELSNKILVGKDRDDLYLVQKFIHNIFTRHWIEPTRDIIEVMDWTFVKGSELGNFEYAAYGAGSWAYFAFYLGMDLEQLEEKIGYYLEAVEQMNQPTTLPRIGMYQQAVKNLLGKSEDPIILKGDAYDEEEMEPVHLKDNIEIVLHNHYFIRMFMAFLFGDYDKAQTCASNAVKYEEGAMASYFIPLFDYYQALIYLGRPDAKKQLSKVNRLLKKMKKCAEAGPANYLHQYTLMKAEKARVKGQAAEARMLYEDAIFQARKARSLLDEAVAWELGGKFYIEDNRPGPAGIFLRQSYELFAKWGALAKVRHMEANYAEHLNLNQTSDSGLSNSSNMVTAERLDFLSLVKTLQTLSTEIELSRLLEKMMGIVIENAGAERGLLILEKEGEWEVIAEKDVNQKQSESVSQTHLMLDASDEQNVVPAGIIYYVIRTQESLVINDVNDSQFSDLAYFKTRPVKSILCIPLTKQNRLIGITYLENTLSSGAFTPRILAGLELLSGQLAISLENAMLYEGLEQKVRERTAEVVSQKVEIEEQADLLKEKNKKLLDMGEFKDNMTSMIVHDLKNPLNSIVNASDSKSVESQNEMMRHSGKMMLNMVMNILDVSKYEESKMMLTLAPRNLHKLVGESVEQVSFLAVNKQINLSTEIDEGLEVFADPDILQRIIVNMLTNAIKYTPVNGEVKVVAEKAENEYIKILVADTGPGIKPENLDFVFRKFAQADKRHSGGLRSTGLGLTFCHMAVEAHDGKIGVESVWGEGSTFWFTIREGQNSEVIGKTAKKAVVSKSQNHTLNEDAKAYLLPFANRLAELPIYKVSQIRKVVSEIDENQNDDTYVWINAIDLAVKAGDQEQLERLVKLVSEA